MRVVLFILSLLFILPPLVLGQTVEERLKQKEEEIRSLEVRITELQSQAKTLNTQITLFNNQIQVTRLRISQTEQQIELLADKISRLEVSLDRLSQILENRIAHTYRQAQIDPIYLFFSSSDLPSFLSRYKYLKVAQIHDRKLITQVAQTQVSYQDQKAEEENLKLQLEGQRKQLADQLSQKQHLLQITKNDEKKYQSLLAAAHAEQEAIRLAMRTARLVDGSPIGKGEAIALIGNTGAPGCSTGAHLHLEVVKDGNPQDPSTYLKSSSVNWANQPDGQFGFSGNWDFPVESPRITQGYGMTYWARIGWYGGGPHTGIDMTSENVAIRSPESGTLYRGSTTCKGSTMKYVAIDHGSNLFTWYFHVQ